MQEEWLDIVNEQDEIIGKMPRSEAYEKKLFASLRASWLMIKNSDGKLWIPRRHPDKKVLPNVLDGSVVGHVSSGETYEECLLRETKEEAGIDLAEMRYRFVGKLSPYCDRSFCFASIYEVDLDQVLDWNRDDFIEYYWLSPQEIIDRIAAGQDQAKDTLLEVIKKFYL